MGVDETLHARRRQKDLLRVLARCQGVADKKSTMPVRGNVPLEVSGTDKWGPDRCRPVAITHARSAASSAASLHG